MLGMLDSSEILLANAQNVFVIYTKSTVVLGFRYERTPKSSYVEGLMPNPTV